MHDLCPLQRYPGAVPFLQSMDKQVRCDYRRLQNVCNSEVDPVV